MEGFVCQVDLIDKTLVTVEIIKIYFGNHLMRVKSKKIYCFESFCLYIKRRCETRETLLQNKLDNYFRLTKKLIWWGFAFSPLHCRCNFMGHFIKQAILYSVQA